MATGEIELRIAGQQRWTYPIERTQFSISGQWSGDRFLLELRTLFYFQGEAPHEIGAPVEKRGPLFQFVRPIAAEEIVAKGPLHALELADASYSASEAPFPGGISFGTCHLAVREMTVRVAWLRGVDFECQVHGVLQVLHDDPLGVGRRFDGATFELALRDLAFQGVWLESDDPADEAKLERFLDDYFGTLELGKEVDRFDDAVVLRAGS